ncbi:hypothetical protein N7463_010456 [Penicillium fimorum]|uniref:Uncharacterized protein n=1 Tax=Penicillium fimorum TaxID=1882269 RepID=A0A9W9XK13_9EURO|nr:hypothetical protein N7463_010456 [Penicillium fimorum]
MLHSALYRIVRIFLVTLDFWFNTDQSSFPPSQAQRSGKPSQSIPLENLTTSLSARKPKMSSSDITDLERWEVIYKEDCLSFKAGLETQAQILRNDTEGQEVDRLKAIRKELISLSHQAERIKEAALEMVDENLDSVYVCNATPEWLSSGFGDPQLEQIRPVNGPIAPGTLSK